jgi:hypothetical protein
VSALIEVSESLRDLLADGDTPKEYLELDFVVQAVRNTLNDSPVEFMEMAQRTFERRCANKAIAEKLFRKFMVKNRSKIAELILTKEGP